MTLREIKNEVKQLDPVLQEKDPEFKTAVVMLSAFEVGTGLVQLKRFTGYGLDFVSSIIVNLQQNGVWKQGKFYIDWLNEETGTVAFWCDVLVALGFVKRV